MFRHMLECFLNRTRKTRSSYRTLRCTFMSEILVDVIAYDGAVLCMLPWYMFGAVGAIRSCTSPNKLV